MSLTNFVLDKGYKLLCFDHRGMGLSSPVTARSVLKEGEVEKQAEYLKLFRATEAVKDLEALRLCLTREYEGEEKRKWSILGQSYGGFLCTTYLSFYPEGLREVCILGGLPPVREQKPDNVIRRLVTKVRERNERYYAKYPEDVERVKTIVRFLNKENQAVPLPSGGILTAGRFLELGIMFGFHGGLDIVHEAVLQIFRDLKEDGEIGRPSLGMIERLGSFDEHVIYAVLHEVLYCQGEASEWAFDRVVMEEIPDFQLAADNPQYLFTGEMVFRRAFDDYRELQELKQVTDLLSKFSQWPDLYDVDRLRKNQVPVFAAVYTEDMYVVYGFSMDAASIIKGCKTFVTNQMYHDAMRSKTDEVLKGLFALRDDTMD